MVNSPDQPFAPLPDPQEGPQLPDAAAAESSSSPSAFSVAQAAPSTAELDRLIRRTRTLVWAAWILVLLTGLPVLLGVWTLPLSLLTLASAAVCSIVGWARFNRAKRLALASGLPAPSRSLRRWLIANLVLVILGLIAPLIIVALIMVALFIAIASGAHI